MPAQSQSLGVVALPETRQLDVLARLLERRGARVLRCPLVAIHDSPHAGAVVGWLDRFVDSPPALFIVYTGEGVYRLVAAAERAGRATAFVHALSQTQILTRGPKPVRALKTLGIEPHLAAAQPTTEGIVATLDTLELNGMRIGVQYYGAEANAALARYLESRNAEVDPVMPYVYASEADDKAVESLIHSLAARDVDAIAFTSKAQVERLFAVSGKAGLQNELASALRATLVAAVGPVVASELERHGCRVDVMPTESFFMKPLVTGLIERLRHA
ncbi:MAG: uroporphyrinogen-III synthase [Gammaproteobacteria bacterium]